ncbi:uncharacterized protein STEHIDRAFT_125029 [Stereum hirsutum FP-91666 SS1]|uniref:uncharacterized protein n=1 Tax=Stereum hirsutum (strain FP-91666) TaxID=721885 RepID=UPI000444A1AC|nr:uncharacterized protein STEHIDRAFT_125029 [Stereum hirsutum FP-91666 SS1]EIM81460.1 hypothetical protein STEHIDRAFT_125029 [Stereum hirsutum FP-91666 SS1]
MKFFIPSLAVLVSLVLAHTVSAAFIPADPTEAEAIGLSPQIAGQLVATEVAR